MFNVSSFFWKLHIEKLASIKKKFIIQFSSYCVFGKYCTEKHRFRTDVKFKYNSVQKSVRVKLGKSGPAKRNIIFTWQCLVAVLSPADERRGPAGTRAPGLRHLYSQQEVESCQPGSER